MNCSVITLRLQAPTSPSSSSTAHHNDAFSSRSATLVASTPNSDYERDEFSDDALLQDTPSGTRSCTQSVFAKLTAVVIDSPTASTNPWSPIVPPDTKFNELRKRKLRKRPKPKAYLINTSDEEAAQDSSDCDGSDSCPPTPRDYFSDHGRAHHHSEAGKTVEDEMDQATFDEIASLTFGCEDDGSSWCAPHTLPQAMTTTERMLDSFSPYVELCHPRCDFGNVIDTLLKEWYAVGTSLLATAA